MWSKMFPESQIDRPMINPLELLKQFPALSSNPLLYKSYYLYKKRKSEYGSSYLTLEAFTYYFTQEEYSLTNFELASDLTAFEQPPE